MQLLIATYGQYNVKPKTCITIALFQGWFTHFFISVLQKYCRENNVLFQVLLIVYNSTCRLTNLEDFRSRENRVSFLQRHHPAHGSGVYCQIERLFLIRTFRVFI